MIDRILLPLLLFVALSPALLAQDATPPTLGDPFARDTVTVRKVTAVNGFTTAAGERITLLGVAAAKSKAIDADDATQHLAGIVEGETVVLVRDTTLGPDKKGSKLRYVYVAGRLVNRELIDDGYAVATGRHALAGEFASAEKESRKQRKAAWGTERVAAIQCQGITKKGTQCSRSTTSLSGKCWQHE